MSETEHTVFGTSLVLDDKATEALHKIREGFEHVSEKIHETEHEFTEFARQALEVAVGLDLSRGLDSIKEMGEEFFKAAEGEEENVKSLAGVLAMGDKAGTSMAELRTTAGELNEELLDMGIASGVSGSTMIDTFEMIAARSNKSASEIKNLVGQVALAGKAVPGGADAIAAAYRDLESGVVRPKNAIVQLIKQSGLAAGSARQITHGLQEMLQTNPAKVFELADKAIGRMGDKMKDVPMTFAEVVTSLKGIREEFFAAAGEPMMRALSGPLTKLKDYFRDNKEEFKKFAEELGEHVGEWIKEAAENIRDGFQYLETHADEIKKAIQEGFTTAKEVVEFILAHKEALAIAFGAKMVLPGAIGAVRGIGQGISIAKGLGGGGIGLAGGAETAAAGAGLAGAAMFAAAAAAAALAWTGVADQTMKLKAETDGFKDEKEKDFDAKMAAMKSMAASSAELSASDIAQFDRWSSEVRNMGDVAGMNSAAIGIMVDHMWAQHRATRDVAEALEKTAHGIGGGERIVAAYNQAEKTHDEATEKLIASMVEKDPILQGAFVTAGKTIAGGFDHLIAMLSKPVSAEMQTALDGQNPKPKPDPPTNFNGGQVFNIHQEFKDADPDRMIIAFKNDFVRAVQDRRRAMVGSVFGV
jgi:hypothetical protein